MEEMVTDRSAVQVKKAYTKPVVNKIRLVAEEAVLALCKEGTGGIGIRIQCFPDRTCLLTRRS